MADCFSLHDVGPEVLARFHEAGFSTLDDLAFVKEAEEEELFQLIQVPLVLKVKLRRALSTLRAKSDVDRSRCAASPSVPAECTPRAAAHLQGSSVDEAALRQLFSESTTPISLHNAGATIAQAVGTSISSAVQHGRDRLSPPALTPPPRPYQIRLYQQAMKQNSICVSPTGSGKTLVAAMVIHEMLQLNLGRKAVFLLHRVPLVDQQAEALRQSLGKAVKVVGLTGHSSKKAETKNLLESNQYDVLVVIADKFLQMLDRNQIQASDTCVWVVDECHNATKDHPYAKVLARYHEIQPDSHKPKILGLTASPVAAPSIEEGIDNLRKLSCLMDCQIVLHEDQQPLHLPGSRQGSTAVPFADMMSTDEKELCSTTQHSLQLQFENATYTSNELAFHRSLVKALQAVHAWINVVLRAHGLVAFPVNPSVESNFEAWYSGLCAVRKRLQGHEVFAITEPGGDNPVHIHFKDMVQQMVSLAKLVHVLSDEGLLVAFKKACARLQRYSFGHQIISTWLDHQNAEVRQAVKRKAPEFPLCRQRCSNNKAQRPPSFAITHPALVEMCQCIGAVLETGAVSLARSPLGSANTDGSNIAPKTRTLLHYLASVRGQAGPRRTLVFARRKATCRRIVAQLERHVVTESWSHIRPAVFVGHGADSAHLDDYRDAVDLQAIESSPMATQAEAIASGMSIGSQQRVLREFRQGHASLLVCTSVLEEGLDVPSCDTVVRLDVADSVIGLVQSRGRARHPRARFVAIIEQPNFQRMQDEWLTKQEQELFVKEAIRQFCLEMPSPKLSVQPVASLPRPVSKDYVSEVSQRCQPRGFAIREGPYKNFGVDHAPDFEIEMLIVFPGKCGATKAEIQSAPEHFWALGRGGTKAEAKQSAAKELLRQIEAGAFTLCLSESTRSRTLSDRILSDGGSGAL